MQGLTDEKIQGNYATSTDHHQLHLTQQTLLCVYVKEGFSIYISMLVIVSVCVYLSMYPYEDLCTVYVNA